MKKTLLLTSLLIGGIFVTGCSNNETPAPAENEAPPVYDTADLDNEDEDFNEILEAENLIPDLDEESNEEDTYDNEEEILEDEDEEENTEDEEEM